MEQVIQSVLEQNEEVKWEGRQDPVTAIVASFVGILIIVVIGAIFYFIGSGTNGTCAVNGVAQPIESCNGPARIAAYFAFVVAIITPFFAYWRYKVTHYLVTNKRLIIKSGLIGADINSIYYDRVHTVSVNVGVIGKIFGTGNIMIDTGKTTITNSKGTNSDQVIYDRFASVKNPYGVYKIVQEMLTANKSALYSGKGM